jgi:c-di-GMP-binding flagellar brake protein YcgR
MPSGDPERRRYPRIKAKIPIELRSQGMAPMRTATDEISVCGCYIETMFTMDLGTKLDVILSVNKEKLGAKGVVATKYPQVGNGIDFIDISPDDLHKLSEFIEQCEREDEPEGEGGGKPDE